MEAAGFERFSVFGYSFTGVFAPWLAHLTGRVDAVVSGAWADLTSRFDNRAALSFYRELSELPPDFLVDNLPCPLFAFWGDDDEEIARGGGVRLLAAGLDRRGLKHASFPGYDHEGMLAHINEAVPSVLAWVAGLPPAE